MFWALFLAHLIADFPLQTDAMVQAKKTPIGLTVHVAIHLATMLVVLYGIIGMALQPALWGIVTVTALHFGIDTWKNIFSQRWPQWIVGGYLQDQVLHTASIAGVAYWFSRIGNEAIFAIRPPWLIYACGFILVTHGWFVTERVLAHRNRDYQQWVSAQLWPRLMSRTLLFSVVLLGWNPWGALVLITALGLHWFDLAYAYRWRAMLIDVSVVASVVMLLQPLL